MASQFSPTFAVKLQSPRGAKGGKIATTATQTCSLLLSACCFCFVFGCCIGAVLYAQI